MKGARLSYKGPLWVTFGTTKDSAKVLRIADLYQVRTTERRSVMSSKSADKDSGSCRAAVYIKVYQD